MIEIAKQVVDFYLRNGRKPKASELQIAQRELLETKGCVFVTVYYKGEIRGSAGNVKEIEEDLATEVIENTIKAISGDSRFSPISPKEWSELKIRIDKIVKRELLKEKSIKQVDPATSGIIAIKWDYSCMGAVLPNINPKMINGEDFILVLKNKLNDPNFAEKNYIIYEIKTEMETSF